MPSTKIIETLASGLLLAISCGFAGCSSSHAGQPKLTPPAKVENSVKEPDLTTIKLTAEAEKRLEIATATIEYKSVGSALEASGEVMIPPGQTMMVAAPLAGTLEPGQSQTLVPGQAVRKGETIFRIKPFLAPERDLRVQLERDIASLTERIAGIRQRKERAEILAQEKAGSQRALEEAQADLAIAEAELKGALERLQRFDKGALDSDFNVPITAPIGGIIQKISAGVGEVATGGAPLVEIGNYSNVWIRVPVYVGDLPRIVQRQAVSIHQLNDPPGATGRLAQSVNAPPSAEPISANADLYYALANGDGALRPGQRVGVTLALKTQEQSLVIPWSAVIHDIHGSTWVYENTAPQTFVRRPVEVRRVVNGMAVLGHAPPAGTRIVTAGVAELFGTEFGAGK